MVYDILNFWFPWVSVSLEVVVLQFYTIYTLRLVYASKNVYYTLLYVCFLFFLFGIYLSFFQVEIFTGFLWLLELTILFVYLLVLFYLNFKGYTSRLPSDEYYLGRYSFFLFYILVGCLYFGASEGCVPDELLFTCLWENYYESLVNFTMNDFSLFLLSYYYFNSLEFFFVGLILLIGSIVCINLYRSTKETLPVTTLSMLKNFDFFKDSWKYDFLRRQNLTNQNLTIPATRVISKKL